MSSENNLKTLNFLIKRISRAVENNFAKKYVCEKSKNANPKSPYDCLQKTHNKDDVTGVNS